MGCECYHIGKFIGADPDCPIHNVDHPDYIDRDELARLRAEVAALKEEHHFQACLTRDLLPYQERAVKAEAEIDRLRAEVAALKKDADRYRWLRSSFRVARWDVKYWTGEFWDVMYGDAMDKQIDAALKEGS